MFLVFVMYALFGSIFSVGKIALTASQPYFLTSIRMLVAGSLILGYLFIKDKASLRVPKSLWMLLVIVAFFNVFITNAFEFWGLQYMSAGKTCLIYSAAPFVAAFSGYFLGIEEMTFKKWLGLFIGIVAFCPMMLGPWFEGSSGSVNTQELLAEGALLTSAISCVIGWHYVKKLTVVHQIPGAVINGYSFLLAAVMCLIPSLFLEKWNPVPVTVWPNFLWTLLYIVIIHNLICYGIYAFSLRRFSVTFMSFAGLTCPLFAGLFGFAFLDEEITMSFVFALIGIAAGLTLFSIDEQKERCEIST